MPTKISTGRIAGWREKLAATKTALDQIASIKKLHEFNEREAKGEKDLGKRPKINRVSLWYGTPRFWLEGRGQRLFTAIQTLLGAMPTVWIPQAPRGVLVFGTPGSGKTFSAIDPAVESAMQQELGIILYDKKGDQMRRHAPLAAKYGYKVHIFAPGEPFSCALNFLDWMESPTDTVGALNIIQSTHDNLSRGSKEGNEFFVNAGKEVASGLLQMAKGMEEHGYADIAMAYAFLRLDRLADRIEYAIKEGVISEWTASSFTQLLKAKDAEKTIAGILATTVAVFQPFIQEELLPLFIGKSTLPKQIGRKEMIIFKLNDERRSVIAPLIATGIQLCVQSNLASPRKDPLCIFLDELPSLKLSELPYWIVEYRSNGACFVLGVQSLSQLYQSYGNHLGNTIVSTCATHILFNCGDPTTAEQYSKRFGNKDIIVRNRTVSSSTGRNGSRSTSWAEQLQQVPLFSVDELLGLPEGGCVITSPAYSRRLKNRDRINIPFYTKVKIPKADQVRGEKSQKQWEKWATRFAENPPPNRIDDPLQDLQDRCLWAEAMLPLPPELATATVD